MNDPNSPSNSDAPPAVAGQSHSAAQLHSHPLWQQAAGRGRGGAGSMPPPPARGRGRGRAGAQPPLDADSGARYERISLLAVELQQGATGGDGADSALLSSDDEEGPGAYDRSAGKKQAADDDDEEYEYDEEEDSDHLSALGSNDVEPEVRRKPVRTTKKAKTGASAADMMAATAFGSHADFFGETSDSESMASRTSSKRKRDTYKQAFPVKGVTCVGCALANRIAPVERFVNNNVGRMSENALWKMAALTWKLEVVEPAKREGVVVVDWAWRDVANHFRLHTTNSIVGRTHMIQSLTAMRCQVEQRLVRVENGERELDKVNADLCLKVNNIRLEQITLKHVLTVVLLCVLYRRLWPPRAASAACWRRACPVPRADGAVGRAASGRLEKTD
mgnify:CR=1 FL=1